MNARYTTGRRLALTGATVLVALSAACATEGAESTAPGGMLVDSAWARAVDSGFTGGAYVTLTNHDTATHRITAVTTDDADAAELHQTMQHEGMVHMMAMPEMVIARDSTLRMEPGGLHVMLPGMRASRQVGDTIHLVFRFADGQELPVAVTVRDP